jgi:hypothetical protein
VVRTALANFVRPNLTTGDLGVSWRPVKGYYELDGLRTFLVAVRGKHLIVSDDDALISSMLANVDRKIDSIERQTKPATFIAGFDHRRERENFSGFTSAVDRPDMSQHGAPGDARTPQFFSESIASLCATLSAISSERIVVRSTGDKELQTVTYKWSQ